MVQGLLLEWEFRGFLLVWADQRSKSTLHFPQATPESKFHASVSDFYQLNDLLSDEERAIRDRVRNATEKRAKVLAVSQVMVAWQLIGISMGVYDVCHRYLLQRKQFGQPLAALQINQEKLVRMLGHIQAMFLMGWRLCKLYDAGKMTPGNASLAKSWNTKIAREICALGRELLGGNGILSDFNVAKAFCELEPIYTYEGTYEVNALVTRREITAIPCIKPPVSSRNKTKSSKKPRKKNLFSLFLHKWIRGAA